MGHEYMLDFEVPDRAAADAVLRGIPGHEGFDAVHELHAFRRLSTGAMPDAWAKVEATGIYLCDNGGSPEVVSDIQAAFAAAGHPASLREL